METSLNWTVLNIFLPILPLVLRGFIKMIMGHIDFSIINSSELWFIIALISLIIAQDLKLRHVPLDNADKQKERADRVSYFICMAIIFIFLCPISELFHLLNEDYSNTSFAFANSVMTIICWTSAFLTIRYSLKTQKEFNLTAKFF